MGNFSSIHAAKGRRFKLRRKPIQLGSLDSHGTTMSHEGITTVRVDNRCDFSSFSDLCICVVTWNMNGQVTYEDLAELVGNNRKFDLLVVGLQEVPRKNISRLLQAALLDSHILLGKSIMQSIHLYVFGLKDSDLFTKEVKIDKSPVGGFGGLIRRKKGAVAIRLNYKGITMVFISCHLSAHAQNVEKRNSEFRNLLTNNDQLLQEAERGQIFEGYSEGTLTFKPTYKYNIGSSNYDTSYKVRMPSWTDRILFKTQDTEEIHATLHSYDAMDDIHSSDHKPVKAHICLKLSKPS
ncbi:type IV inositol polyphosphate 5-phosphatase 11 isoform X1 [Prunus yedoensis var. nudiflora]|uniref:Type IV inositol polyphosphate 5-phosphatase 11 isoform X1 n=1 Tax=Prunus yedoensis var. nudiflora TaxID=2094558 RepID=A0A314Z4D0_PRUYE|nr:type IV inositol polyphosphate 5-phosphatase 11 isoform X1 [Prunus yedoensis var. nudiflora]